MSWNLEGMQVSGKYLGLFDFTGTVIESRVKYGGTVQHTVVLDQPIVVYGAVRERVLMNESEISKIMEAV